MPRKTIKVKSLAEIQAVPAGIDTTGANVFNVKLLGLDLGYIRAERVSWEKGSPSYFIATWLYNDTTILKHRKPQEWEAVHALLNRILQEGLPE